MIFRYTDLVQFLLIKRQQMIIMPSFFLQLFYLFSLLIFEFFKFLFILSLVVFVALEHLNFGATLL